MRLGPDSEPLVQLTSYVSFSRCPNTLATLCQRSPMVPQIISFSLGTQGKQAVAPGWILANEMYIVPPRLLKFFCFVTWNFSLK